MEINPSASSSTTSEIYNNNISEEKATKIITPKFILTRNKKLKNLVHCFVCNIDDCQQIFQSKQELFEHQKTHIIIHTCPINNCNKSFKYLINLRKHYKQHFPKEKKYMCPFEGCGKSFTASYNLTIHYRIHIGNKPYKCNKCEKCFFDRANYKYHISSKHININSKKLICHHKNCNHKSKSIKQQLMHHDKLENYCIKEKNLLYNLIMMFKKSTVCLLRETESKNVQNKDIINSKIMDDCNFIEEINSFDLDENLRKEFNNILLQSKTLVRCAINQDQYKDLIDD